jgi:putative spermidine/putrescine transport system ATP-binding protein
VLLLDEPLGALDLKLREQMQVELKKLQQSLGITFIFVTHDQGEALSMSDRVAVFNNGRIEQVDAPQDLYLRPKTAFVAGFVGTANVFEPRRPDDCAGWRWSLRPEHIRLQGGGEVQVQGVVQAVQYQGRRRGSSSSWRMATNCWSARPTSMARRRPAREPGKRCWRRGRARR